MLYDPKWEQKTKAEPFSKAHVIAWLETMPADGAYCYTDGGHCLIAQYLTYLGHTNVSVGPLGYYDSDQTEKSATPHIYGNGLAPKFLHRAASTGNYKFGEALERVRQL